MLIGLPFQGSEEPLQEAGAVKQARPQVRGGRARCPHRAAGYLSNHLVLDIRRRSRRGRDTAPYLQTPERYGQHALKIRPAFPLAWILNPQVNPPTLRAGSRVLMVPAIVVRAGREDDLFPLTSALSPRLASHHISRPQALNPKGIPSLSPGLRGTSYPGWDRSKDSPTLKGLHHLTRTTAARQRPALCCNPFRVEHDSAIQPRVARASQPWAGRSNPFGIEKRLTDLWGGTSPTKRKPRCPRWSELGALRFIARRDAILPLPKGEGRGEGEGDARLSRAPRMGFGVRSLPEGFMALGPSSPQASGFAGTHRLGV